MKSHFGIVCVHVCVCLHLFSGGVIMWVMNIDSWVTQSSGPTCLAGSPHTHTHKLNYTHVKTHNGPLTLFLFLFKICVIFVKNIEWQGVRVRWHILVSKAVEKDTCASCLFVPVLPWLCPSGAPQNLSRLLQASGHLEPDCDTNTPWLEYYLDIKKDRHSQTTLHSHDSLV